MSANYESTPRFFRPSDVARIRRNQRRIQIHRLLNIMGRLFIVAFIAIVALAIYRHTQSDARFAVRTIEIVGAVHTPRAAIDEVTRRYIGLNLFKMDIARLQHDLRGLGWVSRIEAEKKLPDTLRIRIVERLPVALLRADGRIDYVDEAGVPFAELSPVAGDGDLPLLTDARGEELLRTVDFVRELRRRDPQVLSRISEVRPVPPDGFALFDRELATVVYANGSDLSAKCRDLYAIVRAEKLGRAAMEYADLRFADRVVIRPIRSVVLAPPAPPQVNPTQITN